jgi:hypothetical protein
MTPSKSAVPALTAVAVPVVQPLLVDIRQAAAMLGVSVFAIRVLCWNPQTAKLLKPVRHGLQFLFSSAALKELAEALVEGRVQFPRAPSKKIKRPRTRAA